jgi:hypothetical protein
MLPDGPGMGKKQAAQRAQFPAIERNFPQTSAILKSGCFQI